MRSSILLVLLASSPALAASPPLCALRAPAASLTADHMRSMAASGLPAAAPRPGPPAVANAPLPAALAGIPFVRHVASAGAMISDLGVVHGVRSFAARSGDQFMLFQVTPDGRAAVSGAVADITPSQMETLAAGHLTELAVEHGLKGLFVRSGRHFQVFYQTPDGQRLIPGVLWDADGKDLTRQQVAKIPGAIPTVVVGAAGAGKPGMVVAASAALPLMRKARFGTIGAASAPHLWMLIDPQCIYSMRAFQMLQPYLSSGKLRLSVIPLSVLDYEDQGQSTKSALALLSKPAGQIVNAWQAGDVGNPPTPEGATRLRDNMAIAQAIGLKGTPTFLWRRADGTEGRINGIPTSVSALLSSIGN